MKERWIQRVALGVLIFSATLVGSRGTVNQENSPANATQPPQSLLIPPTALDGLRVIVEIVDFAIPANLQSKYYPSGNRFD
ncbi:hypothetical protein A3J13_00900 [Candidatus Daviesbacteria bacterium RIFCSPLOWO2_02_FULL_36_8]|uniref:Uncharacterized protein n=1 Tax=Candidatus Daviesbacteria bacterium RIFCSPLOWO2_02_FULL_36_8 TaxID=1797793 RepID=A0A1F5MGP6_9BACT|nr:MAG: hypothetical protein A3J13_00900 [Candidatus Daviesbacteria bacterium RIFCSPLOWO2_02_FULL_36_8]